MCCRDSITLINKASLTALEAIDSNQFERVTSIALNVAKATAKGFQYKRLLPPINAEVFYRDSFVGEVIVGSHPLGSTSWEHILPPIVVFFFD